jgi:hypothetical protein
MVTLFFITEMKKIKSNAICWLNQLSIELSCVNRIRSATIPFPYLQVGSVYTLSSLISQRTAL